jgi:hypothetical protein
MNKRQDIAKRMRELSDALWNLACDLEDERLAESLKVKEDA